MEQIIGWSVEGGRKERERERKITKIVKVCKSPERTDNFFEVVYTDVNLNTCSHMSVLPVCITHS